MIPRSISGVKSVKPGIEQPFRFIYFKLTVWTFPAFFLKTGERTNMNSPFCFNLLKLVMALIIHEVQQMENLQTAVKFVDEIPLQIEIGLL